LKTLSFKLAVTTVLVMILIKILSVKNSVLLRKLPGSQVTMLSFLVYVLDWMIRMVISVLEIEF
jgi:hypothetical protein